MNSNAPWLKAYGDVKFNLEYPHTTISQAVLKTAVKYPESKALVYMNKSFTFKELSEKAELLARGLYNQGARKGDKVVVCLPNSPQAVYALYAINRIGAVACFVHPLSAVAELQVYIQKSRCSLIITLDMFVPKFNEAFKNTGIKKLVVTTATDELNPFMRLMGVALQVKEKRKIYESDSLVLWHSLLKEGKRLKSMDDAETDCSDTAVILFSGGTTGVPKGIELTNLNLNALALQTEEMSHEEVRGSSMLAAMPMFHGFGLGVCVHTALLCGATCILVPRVNPKNLAQIIVRHKPQFIAGVPSLYKAFMNTKELKSADLSFLKGVFSGGDALPHELKEEFDSFLECRGSRVKIREGYGTTECVTASCLTPYHTERKGSIGLPFPDTYYKIVRVGSCEQADFSELGEICISGPTVMKGYLDDKEATRNVLKIHSDGKLWLHTGDVGYMDEDGFIYFRQRIKRIIITNGYNVYPSQVESALNLHRDVRESCVVSVSDSRKLHAVLAFVVADKSISDEAVVKEDIMSHLKKHIAKYAMPREIVFISELPKTKVGKVDYKALEAQGEKFAR